MAAFEEAFSDASQDKSLDGAPSVVADNDECGLFFGRRVHEECCGVGFFVHDFDLEAFFAQGSRPVVAELHDVVDLQFGEHFLNSVEVFFTGGPTKLGCIVGVDEDEGGFEVVGEASSSFERTAACGAKVDADDDGLGHGARIVVVGKGVAANCGGLQRTAAIRGRS